MASILERLAEARSFQVLPNHPSEMSFARRWTPPLERAEGHEDGYVAEDEFVVTTKHFKMRKNCYEAETGTGRIVFLYHLSGQRTHELSTGETFTLNTPCFVAYRQPEGVSKTSYWKAGDGELSVGLGFDPNVPPPQIEATSPEVSFLHEMLTHTSAQFKWIELPLDPAVSSVARSMVFSDVDRQLLQSYVAAKASELLCLTLDNLIKRASDPTCHHDVRCKLEEIKAILEKDLQSTLSTEMLAEKYGIPRRELNQIFEQAYGVTTREFSAMVRMERSVFLLTQTSKPLKQIAFEIGYGHASNFCFAFKRHFGETPKSVRERAGRRITH